MKSLYSKRFVAMVLSVIMVLSMVPGQVLAATEITTSPGSTKLNVEYFTSTLYNWNEDAANAATAQADITGGTTSTQTVYQYEPATSIESGKQYLLVSGRTGYLLDVTTGTRSGATGIAFTTNHVGTGALNSETSLNNYLYTITASGDNYTVKNASGQYLTVSNNAAGFTSTESELAFGSYGSYFDISNVAGETYTETSVSFTKNNYTSYIGYYYKVDNNYYEITNITRSNGTITIYYNDTSTRPGNNTTLYQKSVTTAYYLNNFGGDNTIAAGWTDSAESDNGSRWILMEYTGTAQVEVTTGGTQAGKGFYFTNGGNKPSAVPSFSMWSGSAQNYHIYSGLAASKLSESTNAPFSSNVNAADLFCHNGDNSYTTRYTNVQVPFVYEDGYYYLDSDKYAVYMDDVSNVTNYGHTYDDVTMSIADKPAYTSDNSVSGAGYQPFTKITSSTSLINTTKRNGSSVSAYNTERNQVFGFGMVTDVNFQMTDDGKDANGNPVVFEFCGDDDVWVYVDGTLVLDIGGTHDAITGTINFATGDVTIDALNYPTVGDKAECRTGTATGFGSCSSHTSQTMDQGNVYTKLGTTLTGFSAQGQHTLRIYYLERGRGKTNCLIKFNLPQRDVLTVTKDFTQSKTPEGTVSRLTDAEQERYNNVPFGFTLYAGDGTVVANKTYYIYENGVATGRTASTDANGHFTLTNGQTAKFNVVIEESGSSWYVVEDTLSETAYCTPAYVVNGGALTGGYTSPKVVKNGSNTAADEYNIVCYNYMNSNIPNPYVHTSEDTIVLDYGLPIEMTAQELLANDVSRGDSYELIGLYTEPVDPTENAITPENNIAGTYGDAAYADGKITYTLNKEFKGIETLYYVAKATGNGNVGTQEVEKSYYATGTITIIPATSVYYEENFGSFVTYNTNANQWSAEGRAQNENQETGYVGTGKSTYGSDPAYLNDSGDSNGSSMKADTSARACSFEYDFTGCGTTIYGRISETTAYIRVVVTKGGDIEDQQLIDTRVIADVMEGTYYNIPVYNNSGLDFGTYHVKVTIAKAGTALPAGESGAYFYLDGIRVYKPMGDNETALSAYAVDNENNTVVINIRSKVEGDGRECIFTLTDVDDMIVDLETYEAIGPNEELYLADGFGEIGFDLINWNAQFYKLYIGLKNPDGKGAAVNIGGQEFTINNSSDCYYDISQYVVFDDTYGEGENAITVHTVELESVRGLVSLTNIKVVGVDEFDIGEANNIVVDGDNGEDGNAFVPGTLYFAPLGFFKNDATDDVEDEPVVFVPERVSASVSYSAKTKKATFMVATYTDVSYITVNGVRYDGKVASGKVKFTDTYKNVAAGTVYEVVCFNADGVASEPIYITAK